MMNKKIIGIMALAVMMVVGVCPAFAAQQNSTTQSVTVKVNPTISISVNDIDFGALDADGSTTPATSTLISKSNVAIDVWVKALDFQSNETATADDLSLADFSFGSTPLTFTGSYQSALSNIAKAPKSKQTTVTLPLNINVPFGTTPASYNTTVIYSAVQHGQAQPTTP